MIYQSVKCKTKVNFIWSLYSRIQNKDGKQGQQTFTCSNLTIEIIAKDVKHALLLTFTK